MYGPALRHYGACAMKSLRSTVWEHNGAGLIRSDAHMTAARFGHLHLLSAQDVQELRTALVHGRLPADFELKLARLAEGNLSERYVEQNSHLFFALLLAAAHSSFTDATPAQREHLLRVLAYVRKSDDAIPDFLTGGYIDDQQGVRAAATEMAPLLQAFKAWRLRHQVPAMWRC
jgi:hypothetical protein